MTDEMAILIVKYPQLAGSMWELAWDIKSAIATAESRGFARGVEEAAREVAVRYDNSLTAYRNVEQILAHIRALASKEQA